MARALAPCHEPNEDKRSSRPSVALVCLTIQCQSLISDNAGLTGPLTRTLDLTKQACSYCIMKETHSNTRRNISYCFRLLCHSLAQRTLASLIPASNNPQADVLLFRNLHWRTASGPYLSHSSLSVTRLTVRSRAPHEPPRTVWRSTNRFLAFVSPRFAPSYPVPITDYAQAALQ